MDHEIRKRKVEQAKKLWVLAERAGVSEHDQNEAAAARQTLKVIQEKYDIQESEILGYMPLPVPVTPPSNEATTSEVKPQPRRRRKKRPLREKEMEILLALRRGEKTIKDLEVIFADSPDDKRRSHVRNALRKPFKRGLIKKRDAKKTGVYQITLDGLVHLTLVEKGYAR